jgi:translation elongation factor aEF-1 beta
MGKVILKIKVLPHDVSQDPKNLAEDVKQFLSSKGTIYKLEIQPLAFGLSIIMVTLITEENEGTSKLEESFKGFTHADMSITEVSRMPEI